jgi:phosphoribosylanthranilate isomerase
MEARKALIFYFCEMSLRTFVKISSVNNLSDARYCAGMAVDLIGFIIDPIAPDYLPPESFKEITNWISGTGYVGEFESDVVHKILESVKNYEIDFIQVCSPQILPEITELDLPIILKIDLGNYKDKDQLIEVLNSTLSMVTYFLVEGENHSMKTEELLSLSSRFPLLVGTGFSSSNVNELIEKYPVKGLSLKGGDEIKPGYKDYDELADILEAIEVEDFD